MNRQRSRMCNSLCFPGHSAPCNGQREPRAWGGWNNVARRKGEADLEADRGEWCSVSLLLLFFYFSGAAILIKLVYLSQKWIRDRMSEQSLKNRLNIFDKYIFDIWCNIFLYLYSMLYWICTNIVRVWLFLNQTSPTFCIHWSISFQLQAQVHRPSSHTVPIHLHQLPGRRPEEKVRLYLLRSCSLSRMRGKRKQAKDKL